MDVIKEVQTVIKEVMTDAQMLYTKKDVVKLLEQMQGELYAQHNEENYKLMFKEAEYMCNLRDELINMSCAWLEKNLYPTIKTNYDNNVGVESRQEFIEKFKQAMKE